MIKALPRSSSIATVCYQLLRPKTQHVLSLKQARGFHLSSSHLLPRKTSHRIHSKRSSSNEKTASPSAPSEDSSSNTHKPMVFPAPFPNQASSEQINLENNSFKSSQEDVELDYSKNSTSSEKKDTFDQTFDLGSESQSKENLKNEQKDDPLQFTNGQTSNELKNDNTQDHNEDETTPSKPEELVNNEAESTIKDQENEKLKNEEEVLIGKIDPEVIRDLPSQKESRSSKFVKNMNSKLDKFQAYVFTAGQTLNKLTGYSSIESIKIKIEEQEASLQYWREEVRKAKEAYSKAIANRSASQREVNELLQRKHAWTPSDLERFTELYRSDHANQQAEIEAEKKLSEAERAADEAQAQLSTLISARYHEEQIWSDKIRRASTWGTWGLMGINICLFITVQLVIEPRKRARMVESFEKVLEEQFHDENMNLSRNQVAIAELEETAKTAWNEEDRKVLFRIEQLTHSINQALQKLSSMIPLTSEPAEISDHETSSYSPLSPNVTDPSLLTWRNFPYRLLGYNPEKGSAVVDHHFKNFTASFFKDKASENTESDLKFEMPEVVAIRPIELAGTAGTGAVLGLLVGTLITLLLKN